MKLYKFIVLLSCLAVCLPLSGQHRRERPGREARAEQKLAASSIDAAGDSLMFTKMKARMDSIRTAEKRPTVALVLSGGGAKGAAHVGILKYLEEQQIPIDMILGTSMGGLVGGMYAIGYTAADLDTLLRGIDWSRALSDKVPYDRIPYLTRMRRQRYLLSLPFHYEKQDFEAKVGDGVLYSARRRGVKLSATQEDDMVKGAASSTSFNSLPSGYAYGVNVGNLISSRTVGYQDSTDFTNLPIPFVCVASDMVSCKAKNWSSGPLNTALRSTMSIPVLFEPVRYQDMILIDGGTRNNFPTDLARAMGADIIIGVVLSDADRTYAQINNLADMVMQVVDMLGREAYSGNVRRADVYIHPDLHEYNMLSFGKEEIDTILARGYAAALANSDAIAGVKAWTGPSHSVKHGRKALDISRNNVRISSIEFAGMKHLDAVLLQKEIDIKVGDTVGEKQINAAVERLFSLDALESVSYNLLEESDGWHLVFNCNKGPVHRIGVSGRADTEELVAALLNVGLNVNKLSGPRLDLEMRAGSRWYGKATGSLTVSGLPTLNLQLKGGHTTAYMNREGYNYNVGFWNAGADFYLSGMRLQTLDFRVGFLHDYYSINSLLSNSGVAVPKETMKKFSKWYSNIYVNFRHNTLDDLYFPSRGISIGADVRWLPWDSGTKEMGVDFRTVLPVGRHFAVLPSAYVRTVVDASEDSFFVANFIGGVMPGRYIDSQIPFAGINGVIPARDFVSVLNLDLRVSLAKNLYATVAGSCALDSDTMFTDFTEVKPTIFGIAGELAYNSIIGPLRARVNWSNKLGLGVYAGFGFDF